MYNKLFKVVEFRFVRSSCQRYDEWPFQERSPFYASQHNARDCDEVDVQMLGWDTARVKAFKSKFGLRDSTFEALRSILKKPPKKDV